MRRLALALAAALLLATGTAGWAWAVFGQRVAEAARPSAPIALTGRVVDKAGLLPDAAKAALTDRLALLERMAGPQFVVVTVPTLGGRSIEDYARALGNGWGVGDRQRNDGVILLVAPAEHKVRIEVGKGLETTLSDTLCAEVIGEDILPRFRANALREGIEAGADRIIAILLAHPTLPGRAS